MDFSVLIGYSPWQLRTEQRDQGLAPPLRNVRRWHGNPCAPSGAVPGQYVSQCKGTQPDTDTPKGTALLSWWPTLEWPDERQREIALEGASVSSATCEGMFGFQAG